MVMSKRIKIIFTVSILFNILFLALSAGAAYKFSLRADKPFIEVRANLSDDARQALRSKMRDGVKAHKDHQKKVRQYQQGMEDILMADTFDREAYMRVAQKLSEFNAQRSQDRIEKTADLMETLSVEDRKAMAKHISKRLSGGGIRKGARRAKLK